MGDTNWDVSPLAEAITATTLPGRWRPSQENPFLEPLFLAPFAAVAGGGAYLFRVRDDRGLLGLLPLCPARRYARLPIRHARTATHPHLFDATPLVREGAERAFAEALLTWTARGAGAFLHLTHLREGPVLDALLAAARERGRPAAIVHRRRRPYLPANAATDLDDYLAHHVGPRTRKSYRRLARKAASAGLTAEHDPPAGNAEAWIEGFLAMEAAGWKGRAGTAILSDPAESQAFRAFARAASAAGRLRISRLTLGVGLDNVPVAYAVDVTSGGADGGGVFSLKIAYDEAYADHSPGFLLEVALIERALEEPGRWTDSCAGPDQDALARLWPETRGLVQVLIAGEGVRAAAAYAVVRALERASDRVKTTRGGEA